LVSVTILGLSEVSLQPLIAYARPGSYSSTFTSLPGRPGRKPGRVFADHHAPMAGVAPKETLTVRSGNGSVGWKPALQFEHTERPLCAEERTRSREGARIAVSALCGGMRSSA
jgi:hypothetical protein